MRSGKLSLSTSSSTTTTTADSPSSKLFGPKTAVVTSSHRPGKNPFDLHSINTSTAALPSPTTVSGTKSATAAFNIGMGGVFGNFGVKTPKTPGAGGGDGLSAVGANVPAPSPMGKLTASEVVAGGKKEPDIHPLKSTWVVWYRSPGNKFQDYEKSTQRIAQFSTVEEFWVVYTHLRRPNTLPHVSDYHIFRKGIRPVWEDKENKQGGKWNIRLKKGVSTRYWEDLLLAIVGDQFGDNGDELCGAVLSIRGNEDVLSVWTKFENSPTNLKIK